jgi:hypothetical protein
MAPLIFRCPTTGQNVQAWFADEASANNGETYDPVTCIACRRVHLQCSRYAAPSAVSRRITLTRVHDNDL